jgi:hypothetical protein
MPSSPLDLADAEEFIAGRTEVGWSGEDALRVTGAATRTAAVAGD